MTREELIRCENPYDLEFDDMLAYYSVHPYHLRHNFAGIKFLAFGHNNAEYYKSIWQKMTRIRDILKEKKLYYINYTNRNALDIIGFKEEKEVNA